MFEIATIISKKIFFYLQRELLCLYFYLNSRTELKADSVFDAEVKSIEANVGLFNQEGEMNMAAKKKVKAKKATKKKATKKKAKKK